MVEPVTTPVASKAMFSKFVDSHVAYRTKIIELLNIFIAFFLFFGRFIIPLSVNSLICGVGVCRFGPVNDHQ